MGEIINIIDARERNCIKLEEAMSNIEEENLKVLFRGMMKKNDIPREIILKRLAEHKRNLEIVAKERERMKKSGEWNAYLDKATGGYWRELEKKSK